MPRYLSIWFPFLVTDSVVRLRPELSQRPFVLAAEERGKMIVQSANTIAAQRGILAGMAVADARAIVPDVKIFNNRFDLKKRLLTKLARWCIRFTPVAAVEAPDGLLLDTSGCAHLWGGELPYLETIITKLQAAGFIVKAAIADTIGTAWALARYGNGRTIVPSGEEKKALLPLPPAALRLEPLVLDRMKRLGFYKIAALLAIQRASLRRRFGQELLTRIDQATGAVREWLEPVELPPLFRESLPGLQLIKTATGIEIALNTLLDQLCMQLVKAGKGLRTAVFKGYRVDGNVQQITIGTNRPVRNKAHLFKLFEQKIVTIEPGLGIELFILEAPVVEELSARQEALWKTLGGDEGVELMRLLDRITGRVGARAVKRFLPAAHYWPERSMQEASSLKEPATGEWRTDRPRPVHLLTIPELIKVTAPIPDYPPMLFVHKHKIHKIKKADGPERIEREWWLEEGAVRDYYVVEDETGARYWLFRSGLYEEGQPQWFLHGFFA